MRAGDYIGIMSGTSLDGVDVALVSISDGAVIQKASYFHPMPDDIRQNVLSVCQGKTSRFLT